MRHGVWLFLFPWHLQNLNYWRKNEWNHALRNFPRICCNPPTRRRMRHGWTTTSKHTAKAHCRNVSPEDERLWNEPKIKTLQRRPTGVSTSLPKSHQVFFLVEEVIWSYQTKPPGIKLHIQCIYNGMNSCIVNIDNEKCWNVEHCKQPQPSFLVHAGSGLVSPRRRLVLHRTVTAGSRTYTDGTCSLCALRWSNLEKSGENHGCPWVFSPPPPDIVLSFQRQGWVFMQLLHTAKINSHGKLLKHSHCLQLLLSLSPFWFWYIPVSNI